MKDKKTSAGLARHALASYPGLMLVVFFLGPFCIMLVTSFFKHTLAGYEPTFVLDNYRRLLTPIFLDVLGYSIYLGVIVAIICVAIGFPFCYLLSRLRLRSQTLWLIFLLSILSLSEVIIAFSWSILLSRTAGISNLFVWLGLLKQPVSFTPGFIAELCGFCYLTLPYTILMLYPPVSRLDRELTEAARTMGASPLKAFFTVTVPAMRGPIVASLMLVFVFTLGVYLIPQILGQPSQWTLSVLITDQAIAHSNLPFAAALALFLLLASVALIAITSILGGRKKSSSASSSPSEILTPSEE